MYQKPTAEICRCDTLQLDLVAFSSRRTFIIKKVLNSYIEFDSTARIQDSNSRLHEPNQSQLQNCVDVTHSSWTFSHMFLLLHTKLSSSNPVTLTQSLKRTSHFL